MTGRAGFLWLERLDESLSCQSLQKDTRKPGVVLETEEVARSRATAVSSGALRLPGGCGGDSGVLSCAGTSYCSMSFKYIRSFSSGHSSLHPFLLTGAGSDLSGS